MKSKECKISEKSESDEERDIVLRAASGDIEAVRHLLSLLYREIRERAERMMARERRDHTLQATAIANEAILLVLGKPPTTCQSQEEWIRYLVVVMRNVLMAHERKRKTLKRGGDRSRKPFLENLGVQFDLDRTLVVRSSLCRLSEVDEAAVRVAELRFYGGMTLEEVAQVLGRSLELVKGDWRRAKLWLRKELG